jgi:hypothetical protein
MFDISDEKYEELRLILEKQNERSYTFEEAKEMGDSLIDFYLVITELEQVRVLLIEPYKQNPS